VLITSLLIILGYVAAPPAAPELARFTVRSGYAVTLAAELQGARFLEVDGSGTLFVSRPAQGDITAFTDADGDGFHESKTTLVKDRKTVHGMDWHDGWLWFTTTGSVQRARDTDGDGVADEVVEVIPDGRLPKAGGHWWRSLLVTDDHLYTSVGDSGNITDETTTDRQKIWRFAHDGSGKTLLASGIRNTEKIRLRPGTAEIWGCDHGSDNFGTKLGESDAQPVTDLNPPCELNRYEPGAFYGHPFVTGMRTPRYEFAGRLDIIEIAARTTVPRFAFGAHWAPNGHCFVDPAVNERTGALPADNAGDLFVAFHGSWNSSVKVGYQVARVLFDSGEPYGILPIVTTVSDDGEVAARPVDCVQAPDGSILWSCDANGRVYRLRAASKAP